MLTRKPLIVGIGEILWDLMPDGRYLGGAAANFIFHANQLGCRTSLISRVGGDELGSEALQQYAQMGMNTSMIQIDKNHLTGVVNVIFDENGFPEYRIVENVAWDYIEYNRDLASLAAGADLIYFGSLCQRTKTSRETIRKIISSSSESALKFFDVNLRGDFYDRQIVQYSLKVCDILKLNEEELEIILDLAKPSSFKGEFSVVDILSEYKINLVCITLGERGCELKTLSETVIDKGREVIVKDTVGTGDGFSAALAVNYLAGKELSKIASASNIMGGFIASHKGACPSINNKIYEQVGLNF